MRLKAKLCGFSPPIEWTEDIERYRTLIEHEDQYPLYPEGILGLIQELDHQGQRRMAQLLMFPFAKRVSKSWPEFAFLKSVRTYLQEAKQDLQSKRRLMLAVLQEIAPQLQSGDLDPKEDHLGKPTKDGSKSSPSNTWHQYWCYYFHPSRAVNKEQWEGSLQRLREQALASAPKRVPEPLTAVRSIQPVSKLPPAGTFKEIEDSKLPVLEAKLQKQVKLRQGLEAEVAKLNKSLRKWERKCEQLELELQNEREQTSIAVRQASSYKQQLYNQQQAHQQERIRLQAITDSYNTKLQAQEVEKVKLLHQLQEQKQKQSQLQESIRVYEERLRDPQALMKQLEASLHKQLLQSAHSLRPTGNERIQDKETLNNSHIRARMKSTLELLELLEVNLKEGEPATAAEPEPVVTVPAVIPPVHTPAPVEATEEEEETAVSLNGTFYRRDHGGSVMLENGEIFNIPESLVIHLELQHEAEVRCWPTKQENGSTWYKIDLLFQGDDSFSPIRQYDGYIHLGDHFTYYCVDINDPDVHYPVHRKDIEIQQPEDGTPCTFNVAVDGDFARISRLYRDFSYIQDNNRIDYTTRPRRSPERNSLKGQDSGSTGKREPFLQGCRITIIGGQRKWFEEIVTETGAELAHETGDAPERISAALRRSHALFLLLTSTSHRATWSSVEIAKEVGIPHFTIQGSKSNLRMLLREHAEQIRAKNVM